LGALQADEAALLASLEKSAQGNGAKGEKKGRGGGKAIQGQQSDYAAPLW